MAFSNEFVYGYHGCSCDVAEMLLSGKGVSLNSSENDYDWLGSGIYFWEEAPHRALEWAQLKFGKDKAAVLGAKIRLGHCLNLMDVDSYETLRQSYQNLVKHGQALPKNGKLLHRLDCAVINAALHHAETVAKDPYDTVRCPLWKGSQFSPTPSSTIIRTFRFPSATLRQSSNSSAVTSSAVLNAYRRHLRRRSFGIVSVYFNLNSAVEFRQRTDI